MKTLILIIVSLFTFSSFAQVKMQYRRAAGQKTFNFNFNYNGVQVQKYGKGKYRLQIGPHSPEFYTPNKLIRRTPTKLRNFRLPSSTIFNHTIK